MAAAVSSLTLEAYIAVYEALTKGTSTVQPVTPVEEPYYKVQDLRQVLLLHGLTAGKFVRREVLQQLTGATLTNPCMAHATASEASQGPSTEAPAAGAAAAQLPFGAADLVALGWAQPSEQLNAALQAPTFLEVLPRREVCAATEQQQQQQDQQQQQQQQPQEEQTASISAPAAAAVMPAHRPAVHPVAFPPAPPRAPVAAGAVQVADANPQAQQLQLQTQLLQQQLQMLQALQQQQAGHQVGPWPAGAHPMGLMTSHGLPMAPYPLLPGMLLPQHFQSSATLAHALSTAAAGPSTSAQPLQALGALPGSQAVNAAQPTAAQAAAVLAPSAAVACTGEAQLLTGGHHAGTQAHGQGMQNTNIADKQLAGPAPEEDQPELPVFEHTPWLQQQLQSFAAQPGCEPSDEELSGTAAARLSGRRVAFLLLEELEVAGSKKQALPAGIYQGRAVKYLGRACRPEVCEAGCAGSHEHYNARIIPPAHGPAADIAAGRPVELLLDLQPRFRLKALQELLWLSHADLQDAWLLLKQKDDTPAPAANTVVQAAPAAAPVPSSGAKRAAAAMAPAARGRGRGKRTKAS